MGIIGKGPNLVFFKTLFFACLCSSTAKMMEEV